MTHPETELTEDEIAELLFWASLAKASYWAVLAALVTLNILLAGIIYLLTIQP